MTAFEEEFAAYEGAKYGISCGHGTDSIVIALRALGIGSGDEVITVAWTFFATAETTAAPRPYSWMWIRGPTAWTPPGRRPP